MKCEMENPLASALEAAEVMHRAVWKIQRLAVGVETLGSKVLL
jgi:hypothetical protein